MKDLDQKEVKSLISIPKDKKLERLDRFKYWNGEILLSSHNKNNKIDLEIVYKDVHFRFQK